MNALIDGAVSRARMVLSIMVCALIAGLIVYNNLPKEAAPEIQVPFVLVTIPLEGISPEDAERLLVRPTEAEVRSIEGVKEINSAALEGAGQIAIEFEIDADIDQALVDVREKVDMAKREFPAETREPVISEINTARFPVVVVNMYGDIPERGLYTIARDLQENLEAIPGVLEANIEGEREEVLEVQVDPVKLETYNLSAAAIFATIQANNNLIPAGNINMNEGRYSIKVPGLIERPEDAFNIAVKRVGDKVVTIKDVAEVRRTFKDREEYARFNGHTAVSLQVVKRSGANILETVASVRETIEKLEKNWPDTLNVELTADESAEIGDQISTLQSSIMTAVILVMVIVVGALGLRSAILVGISIPASFLMGFLLLGWAGYTVNMMVLFGLVIAVGILVDGAIVVVEYADRKMAEGLDKVEAFATAGKRMFWPIVASNATTLAAFLPFLFWNSMPGKFMSYLPITLIFVLTSSLFMALIFLPVLGGVVGGRKKDKESALSDLSGEGGDPENAAGFFGFYARMISKLCARPLAVTGALFAVCIGIILWFSSSQHNVFFFLNAEPEKLYIYVGAQGNLSGAEEFEITKRAENVVLPIEGILSVTTVTGPSASEGGFGSGAGAIPVDTVGRMLVDLNSSAPGVDGRKVEADIRAAFKDFVGAHIEISPFEEGPPVGKDVQISVFSSDHDALLETATLIREKLNETEGLIDLEDTRPLPGTEWRLDIDRERAAKFGVDINQVGGVVQLVTNGALAGRFRPDDSTEEVDIRVRYPEAYRSVEALDDLTVSTPDGPTPISTFVDRVAAPQLSRIDRRDGLRVFTLRANVEASGQGAYMNAQLKKWVENQEFDSSVTVKFEGADEDSAEAAAFFEAAALGALFLMGVILLWEFNNFYHVLLTLSAVILSTIGVLIGLQLATSYISMIMTGTGVVALAGIVVNNNIVLIDTFQRLISDGRTAHEAAVMTASQRMRPILLTTGTTICGLLPMVVQLNINFAEGSITHGGPASEWWVPLSTAVVFGLGFSTFVTLIVTPVWLAAPEKMGRWRDRMWDRAKRYYRSKWGDKAVLGPSKPKALGEDDVPLLPAGDSVHAAE